LNIIECENLGKYYGKNKGIENLNLIVEEGEIFGFLGPNGAGKTTTIRVLLGILKKTSGSAKIFGLDTSSQSLEIRKRIAYLPGELGLYNNLSAAKNLKYLLSLYDIDVKWSKITELADRLNLNLNKKIHELSKGNKQKVGNILVLAPDVDLYILDEPTSGLDPLNQRIFYEILRERQLETGSTVFLSSHLLPEVEKVANKVGIIRDGSLIEVSTIANLKKLSLKSIEIFTQDVNKIQNVIPKNYIQALDVNNDHIRFLCSTSNLKSILEIIQTADFDDLNIKSPALDDIFMRYYGPKRIVNEEGI
jgi:ABC-2 type transport system ATP-binding protein